MNAPLKTAAMSVPAAGDEGLLNALPLAVLRVSAGGEIEFANTAASTFAPGRRMLLAGKSIGQVFGDRAEVTRLVQSLTELGVAAGDLEANVEMLGISVGVCAVTAVWLDEQNAIAVTLARLGRRRSIDAAHKPPPMARTLAHEVRNPLAGIRGAAQLIGRNADADTRTLTDLICAEVDRIRRLTDRIDTLDSMPRPEFRPINVHAALDRVAHLVRQSFPDVTVGADYDPSLPNINADLDQLIQAFLNIAKNAAEAAPTGGLGVVRVVTRFRAGARMRKAHSAPTNSVLEVAIIDNGHGIPPQVRDRLFEPFATSKADGAGLGLAVAAHIIEQHGGRIDVDSAPGATTFRIVLPLEHPR